MSRPSDQFSVYLLFSLIGSLLFLASYIALNEEFVSQSDSHHDHSRIKHLGEFKKFFPNNFSISFDQVEKTVEKSYHALIDHSILFPDIHLLNTSWVHQLEHLSQSENAKISYSKISKPLLRDQEKCTLSFPSTCSISPYVKYWDNNPDCFSSPLRNISGYMQKDIAKRKFVVFQPDLGGWNNIRMALEVVILFAYASGRILVLPPDAVLYLLNRNKNWDHNKSGMDDYIDFHRLTNINGLETMPMDEFLSTIALNGLLYNPLPNNDTQLRRQALWDYLESSCYVRPWSPGKIFVSFNITSSSNNEIIFGNISDMTSERYQRFAIGRSPLVYDEEFHSHRVIYFPGHDKNRLLTHFYTMIYFPDIRVHNQAKRFMRDRVRYLDEIYCSAGTIVEHLYRLSNPLDSLTSYKPPNYVAYHIRRGEFQQTHTRLDAETIMNLTIHLIPNIHDRIVYISTDESNRTFFQPFIDTFKEVKFLSDYHSLANIEQVNPNHIGMIEQVVCASADIFIGTPLSTFTAYITRMRGYMNDSVTTFPVNRRGIYKKTYYFMKNFMHRLQEKPYLATPFWIRDFIEPFEGINNI